MYNAEGFLKYASNHFSIKLEKGTIEEVKNMSTWLRNRKLNIQFVDEFILDRVNLKEEFSQLVNDMDLDNDILSEFDRNQERTMLIVERFSYGAKPHPKMFEDLRMTLERLENIIGKAIKTEKISSVQAEKLFSLLQKISDSNAKLFNNISQYYNIRAKYYADKCRCETSYE